MSHRLYGIASLKHSDHGRLSGEVIGRLGESEPDAGADGGDEGEGGDVDGGEEGANARADELGAHAEGDDVLVRRDGEEEEPDRGRVLGQAQRHALENGVQGQRQHHEESAQGCLIFDAERERSTVGMCRILWAISPTVGSIVGFTIAP